MRRLAWCFGMSAALLAACSSGKETNATSSSGSGGGGGGSNISCQEPAALALAGTWAARGQLAVKLQGQPGGAIAICPADQVGETNILLLVTMEQSGTTLSNIKATLCSVELPVTKAIVGDCDPTSPSIVETQIVVPPKFISSLPMVANATATGTVMGTSPGAGVNINPFQVTLGSSAAGTSMPTWQVSNSACDSTTVGWQQQCQTTCVTDCTSLKDDDMDGYPGMTVQVCGLTQTDKNNQVMCNAAMPNSPGATIQGQGYIDFQVNPQFSGNAASSCEVKGTLQSDVLYNLVGGDIYLSGSQITVTSAIKSLPTFQVDPTQSAFRMVRVDGKYSAPNWNIDPSNPAAACQTLIANANQL